MHEAIAENGSAWIVKSDLVQKSKQLKTTYEKCAWLLWNLSHVIYAVLLIRVHKCWPPRGVGGVSRENYPKTAILKEFQWDFSELKHWTSASHNITKIPNNRNWMIACVQFFYLHIELGWLVYTGLRYLLTFSDQDHYYFVGSHKPQNLRRIDTPIFVPFFIMIILISTVPWVLSIDIYWWRYSNFHF